MFNRRVVLLVALIFALVAVPAFARGDFDKKSVQSTVASWYNWVTDLNPALGPLQVGTPLKLNIDGISGLGVTSRDTAPPMFVVENGMITGHSETAADFFRGPTMASANDQYVQVPVPRGVSLYPYMRPEIDGDGVRFKLITAAPATPANQGTSLSILIYVKIKLGKDFMREAGLNPTLLKAEIEKVFVPAQ